jgi:hypothetical protein
MAAAQEASHASLLRRVEASEAAAAQFASSINSGDGDGDGDSSGDVKVEGGGGGVDGDGGGRNVQWAHAFHRLGLELRSVREAASTAAARLQRTQRAVADVPALVARQLGT